MNRLTIFIAIAAALLLSGCATVFNGTTETVKFSSDPPQAEVRIDGRPACKTPCALELSTRAPVQLAITRPGFQTFDLTLQREVNLWWIAPDLMFGGILALLIDGVLESWYTLHPSPIRVALSPQGFPEPSTLMPPPTELEMRQDKELELLGGIFERGIIGIGGSATLGFYLSPEVILELTTDASASLFIPPLTGQIGFYTGAHFKAFSEGSLYFTAGGGFQQTFGQFQFDDSSPFNDGGTVGVRLTDIGPRFGIGNQWQDDTLTVSVEWFSLFIPVHTQSLQIDDLSGSQAAPQRDAILSELDSALRPTLRLLHVQLGLSF